MGRIEQKHPGRTYTVKDQLVGAVLIQPAGGLVLPDSIGAAMQSPIKLFQRIGGGPGRARIRIVSFSGHRWLNVEKVIYLETIRVSGTGDS